VVVGDQKGRVGFGKGKAKEVPEAIRKATEQAKRQMIRVPLREGRTLHHNMNGRGVSDVVAKSIGSQNPYNMIRATMDGLGKETSPRMVASRRGKKVSDILPKRDDAPAAAEPAAEPAEA